MKHGNQQEERPRDTTTKTAYKSNMIPPMILVIFHLNKKMERKTSRSMINSMPILQAMPKDDTLMGC